MKRIVILVSGRGSNMQAIFAARLPATIAAVISNRPDAGALSLARDQGIATSVVDHLAYGDRAGYEAELAASIDALQPDLIVLAGFMRILTPQFVEHFRNRIVNIHPSLLPAFSGLHTHRRALAAGVRVHGCTVHFVTHELDHGPIVVQAVVPVLSGDDEETLAARVLIQEHRIYPEAIRWFCEERLRVTTRGTVCIRGGSDSGGALISPQLGS